MSYRIYFVGVLNIGEKLNKSPIAKIKSSPINLPVRYMVLRKNQPSSPAFMFEDGSYLTRQRFTASLRGLLLAAGFDPDTYASHSFRIGAATTAAAAGLPDWQIQAMGRWSSDCYRRYIVTPQSTLIQASQWLAAQTDSGE